jgi:hypothetical protein
MSNLIGVNNVPKIQPSSKLEYVSLELTDYTQDELLDHYNKWLNNKIISNSYRKLTLLKPNSVIVRLYRFEKSSNTILGLDGKPMLTSKILPVCKVLSSTSSDASVNDILYCSDAIADIATNPTWLQWVKIMKDERPVPEGLPEPDKLTGLILDWRKSSKYVLDKLNPTEDDDYTFIRPITDFYTKPM